MKGIILIDQNTDVALHYITKTNVKNTAGKVVSCFFRKLSGRKMEKYPFAPHQFLSHYVISCLLHLNAAELRTSQPGSTQDWSPSAVCSPLRRLRCSEGWTTGPSLQGAAPCSWLPRLAGPGWRGGVSFGVWIPGRPGRGAPVGEEGAALSVLEAEVEACPCAWLPSGSEDTGQDVFC